MTLPIWEVQEHEPILAYAPKRKRDGYFHREGFRGQKDTDIEEDIQCMSKEYQEVWYATQGVQDSLLRLLSKVNAHRREHKTFK